MCKIPCITASSIKIVVVSGPDFKNTTTKKFPILEAPTPTAVNFSNLCQLRFVKGSLRVCNNISGHHFCYVGTFLRGSGFATDRPKNIHTYYTPNFCPTDDEITLPQGLGQKISS